MCRSAWMMRYLDGVMAAEPVRGVRLGEEQVEAALEAIADFADVKSPYTIGHSRGVADLAGEAARVFGLSETAHGRSGWRDWCTTWDGSACRTPSGTSVHRSATPRVSGCACAPTSPNER